MRTQTTQPKRQKNIKKPSVHGVRAEFRNKHARSKKCNHGHNRQRRS